jgi:hypothetical protein
MVQRLKLRELSKTSERARARDAMGQRPDNSAPMLAPVHP